MQNCINEDMINKIGEMNDKWIAWAAARLQIILIEAADVAAAAIKIQAAFKGFKTRQTLNKKNTKLQDLESDDLPNLNCKKVQQATVTIQNAYKGFKTRKDLKESGQELPDLAAVDVANATLKIQAYYRGFKVRNAYRKQVSRQQESAANIAAAALLCQLGMCQLYSF